MSIFAIIVGGYLIGKISIKGVSLGTAGVFIASIIYGILHSKQLADTMNFSGIDFSPDALKIIENCGLVLFVCSVGLIAGPSFFSNLKKNFKSYILLGVVIILSGGLTTVVCYFIGRNGEADTKQFVALLTGLLSGALTSTPAFSAAKATVAPEYESAVTVGYGISYIFGVIGVVLFVQLVPKILHANIDEEVRKITDVSAGQRRKDDRHYVEIDPFGIGAFAFVILTGIFLGAIHIPLTSKGLAGTSFSLTTTGGVLIAGLIWGHFGHLGGTQDLSGIRSDPVPDRGWCVWRLQVHRVLQADLFCVWLVHDNDPDDHRIHCRDEGREVASDECARLHYGRHDIHTGAWHPDQGCEDRGCRFCICGNLPDRPDHGCAGLPVPDSAAALIQSMPKLQ